MDPEKPRLSLKPYLFSLGVQGFRIQALGLWGLGVRVWSLGFRLWDLNTQ